MRNTIRQWWQAIRRPSARWAAGTLVILGAVLAGVFWTGFSAVVAHTNTLEFCTSCHSMQAFVFEEYKQTKHYRNHAGVRAICADCHVPRALVPKLWRKFQATYNEIPHHLLGTIDTAEAFEARRLQMAERVWATMKSNDSRECRACHSEQSMAMDVQKPRARGQHEEALVSGETCIDCHKGIAHAMPKTEQTDTDGEAEDDFSL